VAKQEIVTVDSRFSITEAIAASDGRFIAVGANAEIFIVAWMLAGRINPFWDSKVVEMVLKSGKSGEKTLIPTIGSLGFAQ